MGSASSENGHYTGVSATVAANGNTTYTVTVTPVITDSACGALTLTNTGGLTSASGTAADCWR
jgi:Tfp pilus assembly protein PilE